MEIEGRRGRSRLVSRGDRPIRQAMIARTLVTIGATVALSACATSGGVPRPFPQPAPARTEPAAPPASKDGDAISGIAMALRGTPYRTGGSDPRGFDCSGFVQYVFAQHGVLVPREVRDQVRAGRAVKAVQLRPGDLLFFETVASGASHVAIAIGGDQFIHAPSARGAVRIESLTSNYWRSRYLAARRIVG